MSLANLRTCMSTAAVPRPRFGWTMGTLAGNAGFSAEELGSVLRLVRTHRQELLEAWRGFFDADGDG